MYISHWAYPVTVLGPGNRIVLYVRGCSRNCPGCIAPEFQSRGSYQLGPSELGRVMNDIIIGEQLDGVTISGGEPFEQAQELLELCSLLRTDDIAVYSGFSEEELFLRFGDRLKASGIGVLITGPYIEELNDDQPLRGSSNQKIIYLSDRLQQPYSDYLSTHSREIQYFVNEDSEQFFSGIPKKGLRRRFVFPGE